MSKKKVPSGEACELARAAANRLHHITMRYAGAYVELATNNPIAFLPSNHPGLHEVRDLASLVLITRAEINALTHTLIDAGLIDADTFVRRQAAEYDGLVYRMPTTAAQSPVRYNEKSLEENEP